MHQNIKSRHKTHTCAVNWHVTKSGTTGQEGEMTFLITGTEPTGYPSGKNDSSALHHTEHKNQLQMEYT